MKFAPGTFFGWSSVGSQGGGLATGKTRSDGTAVENPPSKSPPPVYVKTERPLSPNTSSKHEVYAYSADTARRVSITTPALDAAIGNMLDFDEARLPLGLTADNFPMALGA